MNEHEHCWHTGSDMDSAMYSHDRTITITHFICCHCGQTKTERHEWKRDEELWRNPDPKKHGEHKWNGLKRIFEANFK